MAVLDNEQLRAFGLEGYVVLPAAVPEDRAGVRHSILGRMERHGGRATIRSRAGTGTEVELRLGGS